ncbi:unnamed protein product [Cuscuta campestris]|uniref:RING-type E3 ubiquitin transferase n=1 Tax=Cuscuta campestris TaxID=132261 RepID=A0A484L7S0_9ASTE|nr:unnamed protein product [Cuscuta campestris]
MASESSPADAGDMEFPPFFPFVLAFATPDPDPAGDSLDPVLLFDRATRSLFVIDSLPIADLLGKEGRPPASKASIDALRSVEISEGGEKSECAICLEEFQVAREMPCGHRFHKDCIEKWLGIHGSCPVCRYEMPVEEAEKSEDGRGGRRGQILVSFTLSRRRNVGGDTDHTAEEA